MTIMELSELAKAHWKEVNPEVYQQMVDYGDLEKYAEATARLASRSVGIQNMMELSISSALQACQKMWILTDPGKFYNPNRVRHYTK